MTCIVGVADGKNVYMGADSMVSDGSLKAMFAEGKLWRLGEMIVGGCGDVRPEQILLHHLKMPAHPRTMPAAKYLVTRVVPAMKKLLDAHGALTKQGQIRGGGSMMVGYRGELYSIGCDLSVIVAADRYAAEGSGRDFALGSLHGSNALGPLDRLTRALEAAAHHELHVAPPFIFQSTK